MKKTFLLLAATCCMGAMMAQNNVITYKASAKLELEATAFTPNYTTHTYDASTQTGTLTFPSDVEKIGQYAFDEQILTSIVLPSSLEVIDEQAFYNSHLTTVTIPEKVYLIDNYAFGACDYLTSIQVDAANTYYVSEDDVLFTYDQKTLVQYPTGNARKSYSVPIGVETIGVAAFSHANNLEHVSLPSSLEHIEMDAFIDNKGLNSIIIPVNVTDLGEYAFKGCTNMTWIASRPSYPPTCGTSCFMDVPTTIPIYVPSGSESDYQDPSADEWNQFSNYNEIQVYDIQVMGDDIDNINCYNVLGDGTISYDDATHTLTLNNATMSKSVNYDINCSLTSTLTIQCVGDNLLSNATSAGIYMSSGNCIIEGDGSLSVTCDNAPALQTDYDLTLRGGCKVTLTSTSSYPLYMNYATLTVDHSTLIVKGNNSKPTISYCSTLVLVATELDANHTFDKSYETFYDKDGNAAKDDIVIDLKPFQIVAIAKDPLMGVVTGTGLYKPNTSVTVSATPSMGHEFVAWSDGSTANPYTFTVTEEVTLEATFRLKKLQVTATCVNGQITGGGTYDYGTEVTLSAIADNGYQFERWSDGMTANPYVFVITKDVALEAFFISTADTTITVIALTTNGKIIGDGTYKKGTTVTLAAIPDHGYEFDSWSNGVKDNPYIFTATEDVSLMAIFKEISDGIEEVQNTECTMHSGKVLRNGQLLILREGEVFNAIGVKL